MNSRKTKRIIKKGKRGLIRIIFSRVGIISLLFLLNLSILISAGYYLSRYIRGIYWLYFTIRVIFAIIIFNSSSNPSSKLTWLLIVSSLPLFGPMLYIYVKSDIGHRAIIHRMDSLDKVSSSLIAQDEDVKAEFSEADRNASTLQHYVETKGGFPIYRNTETEYYPIGEALFERMLIELRKAESFIFVEYFIIGEGEMWSQILEILKKKAAAGVEVRLMYDGFCEFSTLPRSYPEKMNKLGIKTKPFSRLQPFVSTLYNYRDHRKIMVIDGRTAFTGGVNLADEYINREVRFGHWKDCGICISGEAVKSMTLLFLKLWNLSERQPEFGRFLNECKDERGSDGFIMPYGTCPLEEDRLGEMVYIDMINRAAESVRIMTPYLVLDGEMQTAITFASERGVDVEIILPGIPDKKAVYALAKTHYKALVSAGVSIYEYTPGFIHSKCLTADGKEGVVGSINFDYRSLYHHFECGVYMHGSSSIAAIDQDFEETKAKCRKVTMDTIKHEKKLTKAVGMVLKQFAPLL